MENDYKVADIKLAEFGRREISLAENEMPALMALRDKYRDDQPLAVAKIIFKSLNSDLSSGRGIIELIDWWFFNGKILYKDFPLELADPSGIFHALSL